MLKVSFSQDLYLLGKIIVAVFLTKQKLLLTGNTVDIAMLQTVSPIATGLTIMEVIKR